MLRIGHRRVTVHPLVGPKRGGHWSSCSGAAGAWHPREGVILISPEDAPEEQVATLWHEIIHAFHDCYPIESKRRDEESVCRALEMPLTNLFRDNPHLAEVIRRALEQRIPLVEAHHGQLGLP